MEKLPLVFLYEDGVFANFKSMYHDTHLELPLISVGFISA